MCHFCVNCPKDPRIIYMMFCICVILVYICGFVQNILGLIRFDRMFSTIRWLHPDDPLRHGYGPEGPPAPRTHRQACREAKVSDSKPYHTWDSTKHVRLTTGINHWCPLSVLNKFDMIWDFCPDMMHLIKTFFERLVIGVFSGSREPSFNRKDPVKPAKGAEYQERKDYQAKKGKYEAQKKEYLEEVKACNECKFSSADQRTVDERVQNLVGYPCWIKSSLVRTLTLMKQYTYARS